MCCEFSSGNLLWIGHLVIFMLDGMFSFVLLDTRDHSFIATRDAFGITPLYIGWGLDGLFSSVVAIFFEFLARNI